jgi:hypothetical protein
MKYNKYSNVLRNNIDELNQTVNDLISKGCTPIGGLGLINIGDKVFYYQTMVVEDESNAIFGYYLENQEPEYLNEVRSLAKEGKVLDAVKLYKEKADVGLFEAKTWVDQNCI